MRISYLLFLVGILFSGCNSVKNSPRPKPVPLEYAYVDGTNISANAKLTVREPEILRSYKFGRYVDPSNPNIMYEAGTFYTVARSQSWNTRPNTPIGSQNFKPTLSLTNKKLNYRTKQLLQQQAVLQATNSEMRHLSKQIVLTKETIKRLEKSAKYEDIQPIIKKLRHANEQLAKKLAELELNKNEE